MLPRSRVLVVTRFASEAEEEWVQIPSCSASWDPFKDQFLLAGILDWLWVDKFATYWISNPEAVSSIPKMFVKCKYSQKTSLCHKF